MDLFNFNPPNRIIYLDGEPLEVGPFSIKIMSVVQAKFSSLIIFNDIIQIGKKENGTSDPKFLDCVSWLSHKLLIDKTVKLKEHQKLFIDQSEHVKILNIKEVLTTITDAQPIRLEEEGSAVLANKTKDESDLSKLYIYISSEIKFTISEFYELTSRQISQMAADINEYKQKDYDFQCALHGAKVEKPVDNRPASEINFTPQENIDLAEIMKTRMEQIKKERETLYN